MKTLVVCIPTLLKPYKVTLESVAASKPLLEAAGWEVKVELEVGCPYISAARAKLLRKALDLKADAIVFIDHDLSWDPDALVKLAEKEDDVVAGTYRFKREKEEYMGAILSNIERRPAVRPDGCIEAECIPAGFLKITPHGVNVFMQHYPELCYGDRHSPHVDLFNHGAHEFMWWGEDYAFCRRWRAKCGKIWLIPDLNITHHTPQNSYHGNYHQYLRRLPGGSESANPEPPASLSLVA